MGKTVLLVDDAASMRGLLSMTLQDAGYNTIEACDGKDALNKLRSANVNMVITDLNMPNMNGLELIRALKSEKQYQFIPIVMLTTESSDSMKREGQAAGAKAWVVKPFKPESIVMVVKKIIG
jgi:two-component system, chemotaxis family, chemotaxis protein CheY